MRDLDMAAPWSWSIVSDDLAGSDAHKLHFKGITGSDSLDLHKLHLGPISGSGSHFITELKVIHWTSALAEVARQLGKIVEN